MVDNIRVNHVSPVLLPGGDDIGIWIALTGSWNFIVFGIVLIILSLWGVLSPAGKTIAS
ncbi:MAG: hypothetical protein R6V04_08980 [bacterium]